MIFLKTVLLSLSLTVILSNSSFAAKKPLPVGQWRIPTVDEMSKLDVKTRAQVLRAVRAFMLSREKLTPHLFAELNRTIDYAALTNLFFPEANAQDEIDRRSTCYVAGNKAVFKGKWCSLENRQGCAADEFPCNPLLFGFNYQTGGMLCVPGTGTEANHATRNCLMKDEADVQKIAEHWQDIMKNKSAAQAKIEWDIELKKIQEDCRVSPKHPNNTYYPPLLEPEAKKLNETFGKNYKAHSRKEGPKDCELLNMQISLLGPKLKDLKDPVLVLDPSPIKPGKLDTIFCKDLVGEDTGHMIIGKKSDSGGDYDFDSAEYISQKGTARTVNPDYVFKKDSSKSCTVNLAPCGLAFKYKNEEKLKYWDVLPDQNLACVNKSDKQDVFSLACKTTVRDFTVSILSTGKDDAQGRRVTKMQITDQDGSLVTPSEISESSISSPYGCGVDAERMCSFSLRDELKKQTIKLSQAEEGSVCNTLVLNDALEKAQDDGACKGDDGYEIFCAGKDTRTSSACPNERPYKLVAIKRYQPNVRVDAQVRLCDSSEPRGNYSIAPHAFKADAPCHDEADIINVHQGGKRGVLRTRFRIHNLNLGGKERLELPFYSLADGQEVDEMIVSRHKRKIKSKNKDNKNVQLCTFEVQTNPDGEIDDKLSVDTEPFDFPVKQFPGHTHWGSTQEGSH